MPRSEFTDNDKRPVPLTGVRQRVQVSTQDEGDGVGFPGDGGKLEAARGLVHDVLHLRQEHHGLHQLHVRILRIPMHVGIGHQKQLFLHAVQRLTG